MPTYQYVCTECSDPLEAVQSFTDAPLTVCPTCSGKLRKVFSAVGVVFKGSGFYRTDSRDNGNKAASKPKKAPVGADAGKESGKSEAKTSASKTPESKSTPKTSESGSKSMAPAGAAA